MSAPQPMYFWSERTYVGSGGQRVTERIVKGGPAPPDFPRYVGQAVLGRVVPGPRGPVREEVEVQFPITADSIEGAMRAFAPSIERFMREQDEEARRAQQQIVMRTPADTAVLSRIGKGGG